MLRFFAAGSAATRGRAAQGFSPWKVVRGESGVGPAGPPVPARSAASRRKAAACAAGAEIGDVVVMMSFISVKKSGPPMGKGDSSPRRRQCRLRGIDWDEWRPGPLHRLATPQRRSSRVLTHLDAWVWQSRIDDDPGPRRARCPASPGPRRPRITQVQPLYRAAGPALLSPTYNAALHHVSMATPDSRPGARQQVRALTTGEARLQPPARPIWSNQ